MHYNIPVIFGMSLQAGIVGLPNVGKSTIFNALTESGIPAENYPFCTIDPNVGIVEVPDERMAQISQYIKPQKQVFNTIEFVDIAGLVRGASKGEGLGNQFLSHIRTVDAIVHVVRCFENSNVTHVEGGLDPIRDIEIIETELLIRDLESLEKRLTKATKQARTGDKEAIAEKECLEFVIEKVNDGLQLRNIELSENQQKILKPLALLTHKPILYVANVDEIEIQSDERGPLAEKLFNYAHENGCEAIRLCGNIEMEISTMPMDDRSIFLEEYNLSEPGLFKLIRRAYRLLGLETFFTAGEKEVRAWTVRQNTTAPGAAGVIHTDFERGFIKAEIYHFDDLMVHKSEPALKDAGKIRLEGKNYVVKDGDVIFFKFNV